MDFRVLGPLEADEGREPLVLGPPKQRALLARLLLDAGRTVSVERLMDDLWGDDLPATAAKMVQIYVSGLRKAVGPGRLVTRPPGYCLELAPGDDADLARFERLAAEGRTALAAGDPATAASRLRAALGLWRGPALAEFAAEPFARAEGDRLAELRLAVLEERLQADLELGAAGELVPELEALIAREPLRDRLREQLMLALYRAGRQGEALAVLRDYRALLDEELGIAPSPRLRELEQAILEQDPSLDLDPAAPVAATPPAARGEAPAPPGRAQELAALREELAVASGGSRRLALVSGEAGAGRRTLVRALLDGASGVLEIGGRCDQGVGPGEPYRPLLDGLERAAGAEPSVLEVLAERAPSWRAHLLWIPAAAPARRARGITRERLQRELLDALEALASTRPVVITVEDADFCDPSTLALLSALMRRRRPSRLLVLLTAVTAPALVGELRLHGLAREIALGPLDGEAASEAFGLGAEAGARLAAAAGGHALLMRLLAGRASAPGSLDAAPRTPRAVLRERLAQLGEEEVEVLGAAALEGLEFTAAGVSAALGRAAEVPAIGDLVAGGGLERWPDGTSTRAYALAHPLVREVLEDSVAPERRAELHRRLGERMEAAFGARGASAQQIARHHRRGGRPGAALRFLRLGAAQCFACRAYAEGMEHLRQALAVLEELPDDPVRRRAEVELHSELGQAHVAVDGWSSPAALASLERAREIGESLEDREALAAVLLALATLHEVRGEPASALETVGAEGGLADRGVEGAELLACALFHQGAFARALAHAEVGVERFEHDADDGRYASFPATLGENAGAACLDWAALSLWFLGRPAQAVERAARALELAEEPERAYGAAAARAQMAALHACRGEAEPALRWAQAAIDAGRERGYAYRVAMGRILRGWGRAAAGRDDGVEEIAGGLEASRATGARLEDPFYLGLLADAQLRAGQPGPGLAAVEEALEIAEREHAHYYDAELLRLRGELEHAAGRPFAAVEEALRDARAVARRQGARSLELRAVLALARTRPGGPSEDDRTAVALALEAVEADDTPDARAAAALLGRAEDAAPERAERVQLTALAWELDGLGELAEEVEPERLLEVVAGFHAAARQAVIARGGHVAAESESGGLAYFGYPRAVERAPQRALRAAATLGDALDGPVDGVRLRVAGGVHTGPAVVGPAGPGARAVGGTPQTARRLAAAAPPGVVLVTDETRRLCEADFSFAPLGGGHRLIAEREGTTVRAGRPERTPFVGREAELALMRGRWEQAAEGLGQAVLVSGEAGIGKSRLLRELASGLDPPARTVLELACSDLHDASVLHPVAAHFRARLAERPGGLEAILANAGVPVGRSAPVLRALLGLAAPGVPEPDALAARVEEVVVAYVLAQAERGPLLAVVEDLHWADPSTLALVGALVDAIAEAPVLLVLTTRPPVQLPWAMRSHLSHVPLAPCTRWEAEAIAAHAGLDPERARAVAARAGGIPLFVEEIARSASDGDGEEIPASLHDSLTARLADLSPEARSVARLAAVIGQELGHALLLAASELPARQVERALGELVEAELLRRRGRPPDVRYAFRHALLRESAGRSASGRARRAMHLRIADAMERALPGLARAAPEAVAHHLEAAGEPQRAIAHRLEAGRSALQRSAVPEAVEQLTRGLDDLDGLPGGGLRDELELELRVPLGNALLSARGYASDEVADCYGRARELCARTGSDHALAAVLFGLWVNGFVRARHEPALAAGRELHALARRRDRDALSVAERAVGWPLVCLGRFEEARAHLDRIPALHDAALHEPLRYRFGQDPGSSGLAVGAWALWGCGDVAGARARARTAIAVARTTDHPLSVTHALGAGALLSALLGDAGDARARATEALALTDEFELPLWRGWCRYALGWAELAGGDAAGAVRTVRAGLQTARETGAALFEPFALTVLAEAEAAAGAPDAAREHLEAAAAAADARGERFWAPRTRQVRDALAGLGA